jgi:hypothetical protein
MGFWISQINIQQGISVEQISQFYKLWKMIGDVQLNQEASDTILWKFGKDGSYSASSAYKIQFLGSHLLTDAFNGLEALGSTKVQTLAWLIIQTRVWTADRLERRGWQNCGRCKLCN